MSGDIQMPNGTAMFIETHAEMCFSLYNYFRVKFPGMDESNATLREFAMELTEAFEQRYKDQDWEALDWYEVLDEYFEEWVERSGYGAISLRFDPPKQTEEGICLTW